MTLYCTYFDSGYLAKGLAMISSLRASGDNSKVLVTAFDDSTFEYLETRKSELNLVVVDYSELEGNFPSLSTVAKSRSYAELFFTCSPLIVKLGMNLVKEGEFVVYLDADLYFFENPQPAFTELGNGSIGIIEHNYPKNRSHLAKRYGTFNVGMVIFRKDPEGSKVLDWWEEKCIEWCYDYPSEGRYADQGYLDNFPSLSEKTVVLKNSGLNLAPWNTGATSLQAKQGKVLVGGRDLIFFHFHGVSQVKNRFVSGQLSYLSPLNPKVFRAIYKPYVDSLHNIQQDLEGIGFKTASKGKRGSGFRGLAFRVFKKLTGIASVLTGQSIVATKQLT